VQLGVAEVIAGTIARRDGDGWVFDLNRLDVRTGKRLGRVFREVRGDIEAVIDALEGSLPELYRRHIAPGRLVVRASVPGAVIELDGVPIGVYEGAPVRRETVEPGRHVLRVRALGRGDYVRNVEIAEAETVTLDAVLERAGAWRPSPLVFAGAGVTIASLAGAIGFGVASQAAPDPQATMRETIDRFYPARRTEATVANVLFGVAAAGAVGGVVGLLRSGDDDRTEAPAAGAWIAPGSGGAAVGVEGRF
jgi:hypothetical protein